ncbi:Spore germination protein YndE [Peribacillus simplex]|uniref:GerAB/ArcD/ProY family transporter n=1 Tax=Peribacillus simplex TaxID=1478 RepID=UPI001E0067E5|nr:endospore germination permease [Peribacillus simplex]CAH0258795.1 Spore germination protein YndE [Peribacillus simplex]
MLEKGKISSGEFLILVIIFTIGGSILNVPALLVKIAKQDAWISYIITTLISLCFVFLYNKLASIYPSKTYVEANEKILGKWVGKTSALLFLFYILYLSSALLYEIGSFSTTQILVGTPIEMIMVLFLLTCIIGVRLGLEVISRTALIFFPWIVFLLFMLFLLLISDIKIENIQPIFEEGMKPIIKGSYQTLALPYVQLVFFLMIMPYVNEKDEMKKNLYRGTLLGGIVLFLVIIFSILVLGTDITALQKNPSYRLGKLLSVGNFFERIEVIVAIIWILSVYFKLTICYYGLSLGLAQVLGLKNHKILHFPLAFIILAFSIITHPDTVQSRNFTAKAWTPFSLTICFLLPVLLLVIGRLKKKRSISKATKGC